MSFRQFLHSLVGREDAFIRSHSRIDKDHHILDKQENVPQQAGTVRTADPAPGINSTAPSINPNTSSTSDSKVAPVMITDISTPRYQEIRQRHILERKRSDTNANAEPSFSAPSNTRSFTSTLREWFPCC